MDNLHENLENPDYDLGIQCLKQSKDVGIGWDQIMRLIVPEKHR
jgi:hypothetical protein